MLVDYKIAQKDGNHFKVTVTGNYHSQCHIGLKQNKRKKAAWSWWYGGDDFVTAIVCCLKCLENGFDCFYVV